MTQNPAAMRFEIRDVSHVGQARRHATALGKAHGMNETACGHVAILATELANNLLRHAGGGALMVQWLATWDGAALELISIDHGAGMSDVGKCLKDGYTTAGTPGTGLGAIKRLSSEFDIHSLSGKGTVVLARVASATATRIHSGGRQIRWGTYVLPATGEMECGDIWRVHVSEGRMRFLVCDGLGHGPLAALAARAAAEAFDAHPSSGSAQLLELAHRRLSGTRGAAGAMARAQIDTGFVDFAGIGNISASIVSHEGSKGLFSHNGTLGARVRKFQAIEYAWPVNGLLIMHSDGVQTRWSLAEYPGLLRRHPAVIAAVLGRDFKRGHDDVTVLVARLEDCP